MYLRDHKVHDFELYKNDLFPPRGNCFSADLLREMRGGTPDGNYGTLRFPLFPGFPSFQSPPFLEVFEYLTFG